MTELYLTLPDVRYKKSYLAAMKEFQSEGRHLEWDMNINFNHFVQYELDKSTRPRPGLVFETIYWLIVEDDFAGRLSLRHELTPSLVRFGGHIGYEIRPSMRRMGYGTRMCALGLERACALGIRRVLITCDDDNIGSIKIIEANGGVLEDRVNNNRPTLTRRYWVDLNKRPT